MTRTRTVACYGNSLLLASVGAVVAEQNDLRVEHVDAARPDSDLRLLTMHCNAVLFDLTNAPSDVMLALFRSNPLLRLIAVDLAGDRLLVLSGREIKGLDSSSLLRAVLDSACGQDPGD